MYRTHYTVRSERKFFAPFRRSVCLGPFDFKGDGETERRGWRSAHYGGSSRRIDRVRFAAVGISDFEGLADEIAATPRFNEQSLASGGGRFSVVVERVSGSKAAPNAPRELYFHAVMLSAFGPAGGAGLFLGL